MKIVIKKIPTKYLVIILACSVFFVSVYSVFATPPISPYYPGETLDPSCAPGDAECTVGILESRDEGGSLTYQSNVFDFTGAGVTATETGGVVTVTIPGGSSGVAIGDTVTSATGGSVLFVDSAGKIAQDNTNFSWDDASDTLTFKYGNVTGGVLAIGGNNTENFNLHVEEEGRVEIVGAGYGSPKTVFGARLAGGTMSSPTALASGITIGEYGFGGYKDTAWSTSSVAAIKAVTTEAFTDSATGTKLIFSVTPNNTTGIIDAVTINQDGNMGIGDTTPASLLTVGNGDRFQVDTTGDIVKIKNVTYAWPAANASGVFKNNGSGTLSWGTLAVADITDIGTSYLKLDQTSAQTVINGRPTFNQINLPTTSGTNGIIYKNSTPWIYTHLGATTTSSLYITNGVNASGNTTSTSTGGNVGIGGSNMTGLTTGNQNIAIGSRALEDVTSGGSNVAVGTISLPNVQIGIYNVGVGNNTLEDTVSGNRNTAIGSAAGNWVTGSSNTLIGHQAGTTGSATTSVVSGTYNTMLGAETSVTSNTISNSISIGSKTRLSASNQLVIDNSNTLTPLVLGDFSTDNLTINGNFNSTSNVAGYSGTFTNAGNATTRKGVVVQAGLNDHTAASTSTLMEFRDGDGTAVGSITFGSSLTAYNTTSDERLKENIHNSSLSIEDLLQIKVRDYTWKSDSDHKLSHGFIAQELYNVYPSAVTIPIEIDGYWMVDYSKLTPLVVKSIQDIYGTMQDLLSTDVSNPGSIVARVKNFLADAGNSIDTIFARVFKGERVEVDTLCVGDICVTEEQFRSVFAPYSLPQQSQSSSQDVSDNITDVPSDTTTTEDTITIETEETTDSPVNEDSIKIESGDEEVSEVVSSRDEQETPTTVPKREDMVDEPSESSAPIE